ncbi:DUF418 domain-containing protein [Streptomyces sp. NPDC002845]
MTQNADETALASSAGAPPGTVEHNPPEAPGTGRVPVGRLIGVDLARGLAVFGMYAAHVGPDPMFEGGVTGFLMELSHGRSSALFALLAGFSLVLITGRTPKTGRAGRQAVAKVVIRALVLLVLGTAMTMWLNTPVMVILAFYGVYFLLVLPLYRLSAGPLAIIAAVGALVLPQLLYLIRKALPEDGFDGVWGWPTDATSIVSLLFTGGFPALTWLPFVIAGMAVARLDLAATAVRIHLGITGAGLAVLGYGGSWLALHLVPGALSTLNARFQGAPDLDVPGSGVESGSGRGETAPSDLSDGGIPAKELAEGDWGEGGSAASAWWSDTWGYPNHGTPAELLVASPHSETTLSIVANTGVAIAVLVGCLVAVDTFPRLRRLARPVIAVGTMSLTAYVLQFPGIHFVGTGHSSIDVLLGFIAAAAVFATLWSRYFRRGPLEWLLGKATKPAELVGARREPERNRVSEADGSAGGTEEKSKK